MEARKFVSRPVEIEAMRFTGENTDQCLRWITTKTFVAPDEDSKPNICIKTLEGIMAAAPGDWIIKGTEGEFYPCKPSVFERKYAPLPPVCKDER